MNNRNFDWHPLSRETHILNGLLFGWDKPEVDNPYAMLEFYINSYYRESYSFKVINDTVCWRHRPDFRNVLQETINDNMD